MPKLDNAIILAAGLGSRLKPLTDHVPKTLLPIGETTFLDRLVSQLRSLTIPKIIIVVHHLKEQILERYLYDLDIEVIENPYPLTINNIASIYSVRHHLKNTLIIDGDLYVNNQGVLKSSIEHSGYAVSWTEASLKEWYVDISEDLIIRCFPEGKASGYRLYGLSYWTERDSVTLKKHIEEAFDKHYHNLFWDHIPLVYAAEAFNLKAFIVQESDLFEIDTLEDYTTLKQTLGDS